MKATEVKTGFKHGRWTILSSDFERTESGAAVFLARCSCGTERSLKFKGKFHSESCGCLQREVTSARMKTHGKSRTPEYYRERWLVRQYGIDSTRWNEILDKQGGGCAICRKTGIVLHVDHDHSCCPGRATCGKCVRGLLCQSCNQALGFLNDSMESLENAIAYLRKSYG